MNRIFIIILVLISAFVSSAYGQEKFNVSGEVNFHEEGGEIIVWLKTHDEYENRSEPTDPSRTLVLKPSQEEMLEKKVSFNFIDVPEGIYCVVCIQDFNSNRKTDHSPETGAPIEPYGFSGPAFFGPAIWEDIKFDVDKNISGIKIDF